MNLDRKTMMTHIAAFERHNGRVPNLKELQKRHEGGRKEANAQTVVKELRMHYSINAEIIRTNSL